MGGYCCNKHSTYIESAQAPHEKSIRLFEEELDLNTVTFYEILSDFNYTFLHFNELIPEKFFDDYIDKKFKNENVKKLFDFKEIRQKGLIKTEMVRYVFLLFCRPSIKTLINDNKTYDKSEFMINVLFNEDGGTPIDEKFINLLNLACNVVPTFFTICNPSLKEEDKKYIQEVQNFDEQVISYILEQIGLNEDLTIDVLNKKFEENPNVFFIYNLNSISSFLLDISES
jgi:hypothetical protein